MRLECINCPGSGCNFLSKPGSDLAHPPPLEFWKLHRKKAELITKIILRETLFHHLPIRPQQSHRDCVKALIEPSFKWPLKLKTVPSEVSKLRKFLRSFGARVIAVRSWTRSRRTGLWEEFVACTRRLSAHKDNRTKTRLLRPNQAKYVRRKAKYPVPEISKSYKLYCF